jgi:hypothetical protein
MKMRLPRRTPVSFSLECDEDSLRKTWSRDGDREGETAVAWADVTYILAFKRDLWAYDRICLEIGTSEGWAIEIDEEMEGWQRVIERLPEYLPGCAACPDWSGDVALPPFARNEKILFRAPSRAG